MKLDSEPEVIRLASELKVDSSAGAVAGIIQFCRRKLATWIRESSSGPMNPRELEALVCRKLKLVFEEVWTDADLDALVRKFVASGEAVFAALKFDLGAGTYAALLERQHATGLDECRYVAVIDCRGEKGHRRYFTKWHEIAHLLTLTRQLELPFHRSTDRSPTERLMDVIAGEIGFPDELLRPGLDAELAGVGRLTFPGVERIRRSACPDASFASTLNASVSRWPHPVVLIEVGMGHKKSERDRLSSPQLPLIPLPAPAQKLRVLAASSNAPARTARFRIDPYMSVPPESIVARCHAGGEPFAEMLTDGSAVEDLAIWRHSDGNPVGSGLVRIETRRVGPRTVVLVQLASQQAGRR
jgi:hypothetical protein